MPSSVQSRASARWPPAKSNQPWPGSPIGLHYPTISMITSHMVNHAQDSPRYIQEEAHCHWCQFRKWATHDLYPTSIVNQIPGDNSILDPNFKFIEENILGKGVELAGKEFMSGCECGESKDCLYGGCSCLEDIDTTGKGKGAKINAYHVLGSLQGCLRTEMLKSRLPIYECNESCGCDDNCPNRVVSKGRKVPLQVFKTENRGWGLRSTSDIKRGQYVGSYVGEVITSAEASLRRARSTTSQKKDVYLFALDKFSDPESPDIRLRGEPYEIDGEYFAGPTRFINHSCNPNLRIFAVVRDHANKPFHDLCFFATKEIPRFTELTFDYTDGISGRDEDGEGEGMEVDGMSKCLCGEANCRGLLW